MNLCSDIDIKIAGEKPSQEIKKRREVSLQPEKLKKDDIKSARDWGAVVARKFIADAQDTANGTEPDNSEMIIQRRLLLSFTATVGFEQFCSDDALCGIAQKSFIDTVKKADPELYRSSGDTGAFSFYYLAYRRGSEIDRRIGQTFAMLCSHDGDPIYQELGEALYCWFLSAVRKAARELGMQ